MKKKTDIPVKIRITAKQEKIIYYFQIDTGPEIIHLRVMWESRAKMKRSYVVTVQQFMDKWRFREAHVMHQSPSAMLTIKLAKKYFNEKILS